jgi:hypothetical protein
VDDEVVLRPVGKDRPVSTIGDQFFRELRNLRVEVVHDIVDYALSLRSSSGVVVVGIGHDAVGRPQSVHVDMTVILQLRI